MVIAGQALVPRQFNRRAPFDGVVADDLRPVADEIVQRFSLVQRTIAAVAHLKSAGSVDVEIRQTEGVRPALNIQSRYADLIGQRLSGVQRAYGDPVARESVTELGQKIRIEGIAGGNGEVLVSRVRRSRETPRRKRWTPIQAERARGVDTGAEVTVSPKVAEPIAEIMVDAHVELVGIVILDRAGSV